MPIPVRPKPFLPGGCPPGMYGGLARLSPGCPPDGGRLHTCYSPVRRSPAGVSKLTPPLPLDLHVLSLSLAFILSQDQTLRCWYILLIFLSVFVCLRPCRISIAVLFRLTESFRLTFSFPCLCLVVLWQSCQCSLCSPGPGLEPVVPVLRLQSYCRFRRCANIS